MEQNKINLNSNSILILQSIRKIIRAIDQHSRKLRSEFNITIPQLITLNNIADNPGITLAKLANLIHLSPSTLVGILDRLELKELVIKKRGVEDRRQVQINITHKGKKTLKDSPMLMQEKLLKRINTLSNKEQAEIILSLDKISSMICAENVDAAPILEIKECE